MSLSRITLITILLMSVIGCTLFQKSSESELEADADGTPIGTIEVGELRQVTKYDDILSKSTVTESGLITVHKVADKLYFEISNEELGQEILLVSRIVRAQAGTGYGGIRLNNYVLRWEKNENRILLRNVLYESVADTSTAVYKAVRTSTFEPIIASFDIKAFGPDSTSALIEVTKLFTTDIPEFSPREQQKGQMVDPERSYVDRIRSYPDNTEITNVITLQTEKVPVGGNLRSISMMINHSFLRLPQIPMRPRVHDERIGYYSVRQLDFSRPEHRAAERRYITRWRLEKQEPDAELSEPVKPIVFYVDPGTPENLVDYIIEGVNDWQPAFEQAGFKNAIIGRKTPVDDPDFSLEDARYSMVRWLPSTTMNAFGPHVHDPRSGEIINSSIGLHHNIQNLLRNWYFVQAGAVDERMMKLPMPDSLMGRLVRLVVAHEIGHTLGLSHNMKASGTVPTDSLRSPTFTRKYGTTPSIMDYARMNYVAQPGDDAYMFPIVSIYDKFAIEWGYSPLPEAISADEESRELNAIASRQENEPMLLFGHLSTIDPTQQREALSDNHVKATKYGIANLERIMGFIVDAAGNEGDDYSTLTELYQNVIQQRERMLGHVVNWVGGVYGERKVYGQKGPVYTPVDHNRQKEAMDYLISEAFETPEFLLNNQLMDLIQPTGTQDYIMRGQRMILNGLLNDDRLNRMADIEARYGPNDVYTVDEMLSDLRNGIWSELDDRSVDIDYYRRNLQRSYLEIVEIRLGGIFFKASGESKSMMRGNLRELAGDIEQAIPKASNNSTKYHLQDISDRIRDLLEQNG